MTHLLFWSLRIKGQADDRRVIRTYGHSNFRIFAACHDLLPRPRTRATHARAYVRTYVRTAYAWHARGFTSASTEREYSIIDDVMLQSRARARGHSRSITIAYVLRPLLWKERRAVSRHGV